MSPQYDVWRSAPMYVKILAGISTLASASAVISTIFISMNANRLQRGDNTIALIAAYGSETTRNSRAALYSNVQLLADNPSRFLDPASRDTSFRAVAPVRGALGFVATCYYDDLCLDSTILSYFCADVLTFDSFYGSGAPSRQRDVPDAANIAFNALLSDCQDQEQTQ